MCMGKLHSMYGRDEKMRILFGEHKIKQQLQQYVPTERLY